MATIQTNHFAGGAALTGPAAGGRASLQTILEEVQATADAAVPAANAQLATFLPLHGVRMVQIQGAVLSGGDNVLGTVPAGKRWFIRGAARSTNPGANSITYYGAIRVGGVTTRISAATVTAAGTRGSVAPLIIGGTAAGIVLNEGESLIVNTSAAGLNIQVMVYEFDSGGASLCGARVMAVAAGNNTLYTCPEGKAAVATTAASITPVTWVYNSTGAAITYGLHLVPSGGAVGDATLLIEEALSGGAAGQRVVATTLLAGDSLVVTASGAGGVAWAIISEIDA